MQLLYIKDDLGGPRSEVLNEEELQATQVMEAGRRTHEQPSRRGVVSTTASTGRDCWPACHHQTDTASWVKGRQWLPESVRSISRGFAHFAPGSRADRYGSSQARLVMYKTKATRQGAYSLFEVAARGADRRPVSTAESFYKLLEARGEFI